MCTVRAYEKLAKVPFPIEIKKIFEAVPQDSYPVTEWTCGKLELADTNTGRIQCYILSLKYEILILNFKKL